MALAAARALRGFADTLAALPGALIRGEWSREARSRVTIGVAVVGVLLAILTGWALSGTEGGPMRQETVRAVLLADLVYMLVIAGLLGWRLAALIAARRAESAGSRLHLRLTGVFTVMALAPTILVAIFATVIVSIGIEGWFSSQIGSVVRNSLTTAESYEKEHRRALRSEVLAMANDLDRAGRQGIGDGQLGEFLRAQARAREFPKAFVFNGALDLRARGEFSYLFDFSPPTLPELNRARLGEVVIVADGEGGELRALVNLAGFEDYFLLVTRPVDAEVLRLLAETRETVGLYNRLEDNRGSLLLDFALLYIGFSLAVIFAAIWAGLWFAERLARPVGRLAGAAQRVGAGDLDVRVPEERGDDEIAMLARVFNRMTEQVKGQRDALVAVNQETERRRRFIEAVLAGVTAGVIRLDAEGRVELINEAGARLLGVRPADAAGRPLAEMAPLFAPLLAEARGRRSGLATDRVHGPLGGREREMLARVARTLRDGQDGDDRGDGYVLTFDDLTELVTAQRIAAWADIARRIAHEIKNPLTPIQLSAERLKRKFGQKLEGDERANFDRYADMIVRQAGDIRRMVDEFSRFARMPAPELAENDLGDVLREAVLLQASGDLASGERPVRFAAELPDAARLVRCDRGLMMQALTNLLKNAGEAVEARLAVDAAPAGRVTAELVFEPDAAVIRVIDNGVGLPETGRARLMEPYVTTRDKGTGLGLAITRKITEEHGGSLALEDAPDGAGAMAVLRLPLRSDGGADATWPEAAGAATTQAEATRAGTAETGTSGAQARGSRTAAPDISESARSENAHG